MGTPTDPEVGDRHIDARALDYLVDLTPRELRGLRKEQPGIEEVLMELVAHQTAWGGKGGITEEEFVAFTTMNERIAQLDRFLAPLAKLAEMVAETRHHLADKRERQIAMIAASVERRGKEHPEVLARYAKTRAYRSAAAKKGWKTRRRNAEAGQHAGPDAAQASGSS
ncbi:hypothetical protein [Chondromyces apiculatus]|uniref:Uncharacterized protein n=1 Tax=Chondromyces apiculatus DSM 436 TaxID=1192034 RepID=A0A017T9B2_9BACT|nr:hypothetical protein [Chondromyces apiculatus]EYF05512.1 Hypothetical protein CAP_3240 [Chondromyces apiculatus DSM 436]